MPGPDRGLKGPLRAAVAYLTLVPVGAAPIADGDLARGVVWFPPVGAVIGGASALVAAGAGRVLPGPVAALLAVAAGAALTGALHLDGLADTADGYGGRSRERALAIMRDHATGAYGTVAIVLDLGLRAAVIASLTGRPRGLLLLVAAGALSRAAAAALGALVPDARGGSGQAALLGGAGRGRVAAAAILAVAIAVLTGGPVGLLAGLAAGGLTALWGWHCRRRLGGVTGDTLGAASEASELAVLLVAAALG
jgi:cobalamin 5'-phosphate synthase/cobalamin synthase